MSCHCVAIIITKLGCFKPLCLSGSKCSFCFALFCFNKRCSFKGFFGLLLDQKNIIFFRKKRKNEERKRGREERMKKGKEQKKVKEEGRKKERGRKGHYCHILERFAFNHAFISVMSGNGTVQTGNPLSMGTMTIKRVSEAVSENQEFQALVALQEELNSIPHRLKVDGYGRLSVPGYTREREMPIP